MDTAEGQKRRHESRVALAAAALLFDFVVHALLRVHRALIQILTNEV